MSVRSLSSERARDLALSLAGLPSGDALPDGVAGRWLRETLLPAACPGATSADACVVRLVSGGGPTGGGDRLVEWEDERYRVDLGAATAVRLERVRRVQKATRLDEALAVLEAGAIVATRQSSAADLERAAIMIKATAPALTLNGPTLFSHPITPARQALEAIVPGIRARCHRRRSDDHPHHADGRRATSCSPTPSSRWRTPWRSATRTTAS